MNKKFKGVIWTDHALERLRERGISQSEAWYAFRRPDQSRYAKSDSAWIYFKKLDDKKIEVVAKKEGSDWIIISVWSDQDNDKHAVKQRTSFIRRFINLFGS